MSFDDSTLALMRRLFYVQSSGRASGDNARMTDDFSPSISVKIGGTRRANLSLQLERRPNFAK